MPVYIPLELQIEIIVRLPVKCLIQYRSVSKTWRSLIDSSEFIADHSLRQTQPEHLLVRYEDRVTMEKKYVSFIDDDSFPHQRFDPTLPLLFKSLAKSRIVSGSNGLLCLYCDSHEPQPGDEMAILWNPSIRKSIAISVPNVLYEPYRTVVGFGVCPVNNDPKIVKFAHISFLWEDKSKVSKPFIVEVYTLSSGKWRSLSNNLPRQSIEVIWSHVVIDRFMYWIAFDVVSSIEGTYESYSLILSFDMVNECFGVIDLPDNLSLQSAFCMSVSRIKESLTVLEHCATNTTKQVWYVWVMEHGVQKLFTKLFTIKEPDLLMWKMRALRKTGEPIIEDRLGYDLGQSALFVYETNSGNIKDLGIHGTPNDFFVVSYMETLLLLNQ